MLTVRCGVMHGTFRLELNMALAPAFTALFGPSGAGKTTTLNLIAGLTRPENGAITLNDRVLCSSEPRVSVPPQDRGIGYIFQESRLFPHMSVRGNLEYGYRASSGATRRFGFDDVLEVTGTVALLERSPVDLSGGERQRVALARALLASPAYLLMDEPLAALDLPTRLAFLRFLKHVHREFALPILYVSHDLSSVLNFADQVVLIRDGRNAGCGPPSVVLESMVSAPLVTLEDVPNILEAVVREHGDAVTTASVGALSLVLPKLDIEVGENLPLNIPASEIVIAVDAPGPLSASNILAGRVTRQHRVGDRCFVDVDAGAPFTVEVLPSSIDRLNLEVGKAVHLIIKASSFRRL